MTPIDCNLGIITDQTPEGLPPGVWSNGRGVSFTSQGAVSMRGLSDQYTPSQTPYGLIFYETSSARYWVHATLTDVFADTTSARDEITPASDFTGTADNRWTLSVFSGNLIVNNGVENPMFWNGTGNLATLTGWDTNWKAKSVRPWLDFLVAINVTESGTNYPHMFRTSAAAVPGSIPVSWDEADEASIAIQRQLDETSDPLLDGLALGDLFIFYGQRSMYRATFSGDLVQVINTQRIPGEYGVMSQNCVVETPLGHVFLSVGDVCLFDGNNVQSIASGLTRTRIFESMDETNRGRSFVVKNPMADEVLICFPGPGQASCTLAAVWNWTTKVWTFRPLENWTAGATGLVEDTNAAPAWDSIGGTWTDQTGTWVSESISLNQTRLMVARTAPKISAYDHGVSTDGTPTSWWLERTGLFYDGMVKLFADLWLVVEGPPDAEISIGLAAQMLPDGTPSYTTRTFTLGTSRRVCVRVKGRTLAIMLSANDGAPVRLRFFWPERVQPAGKN